MGQKPQDYLESVTRNIPLNDLYEVLDYFYNGMDQSICPVLLEIKDEKLLFMENDIGKDEAKRRKEIAR